MGEFLHVAEIAFPLLFQGILVTIQISVLAIIMAIVIGAVVAYMKISDMVLLKAIAEIYIKIFRNTPFMVQVYLAYYLSPANLAHSQAFLSYHISLISNCYFLIGYRIFYFWD